MRPRSPRPDLSFVCDSDPAVNTLAGFALPAVKLASENASDSSAMASSASTTSERRALPAFVLVRCLAVTSALLRWRSRGG